MSETLVETDLDLYWLSSWIDGGEEAERIHPACAHEATELVERMMKTLIF